MNRRISQVAIVSLVLLAALIVATTYWQTWASAGLAARQDNEIQRVAQFTIDRGQIYAPNGKTVLAGNVKQEGRRADALLPHLPDARPRLAGRRLLHAEPLADRHRARREQLPHRLERRPGHDPRHGRRPAEGHDDQGQRPRADDPRRGPVARAEPAPGKCGAAVVLDPSTGAVEVMASTPGYDPNLIEQTNGYAQVQATKSPCRPSRRRRSSTAPPRASSRRARRSRRSRRLRPSTTASPTRLHVRRPRLLRRVRQAGAQRARPERARGIRDGQPRRGLPALDQRRLLRHRQSSAPSDPQRGEEVSASTRCRRSRRRATRVRPRALRRTGSSSTRNRPRLCRVDPGPACLRQDKMLATPLQMAHGRGGGGERGIMLQPTLIKQFLSPGGSCRPPAAPEGAADGDEAGDRRELKNMMVEVVQAGTGRRRRSPVSSSRQDRHRRDLLVQ